MTAEVSKTCLSCGALTDADSRFCKQCGKEIAQRQPSPISTTVHSQSNRKQRLIAACILGGLGMVAVIAFVVLFIWIRERNEDRIVFDAPPSSSTVSTSGKLTTERAQRAVNRFVRKGRIKVTGIQETPQQNAAKADLMFEDFQVKSSNGLGGTTERQYSGMGAGYFTHYNDGRWVLTKIETSEGLNSTWWSNLNIEVP